jgi:hypothetical protein
MEEYISPQGCSIMLLGKKSSQEYLKGLSGCAKTVDTTSTNFEAALSQRARFQEQSIILSRLAEVMKSDWITNCTIHVRCGSLTGRTGNVYLDLS